MKFKCVKGQPTFKAYGYQFSAEAVDVTEKTLIEKFKQYPQLEDAEKAKPKAKPKQ